MSDDIQPITPKTLDYCPHCTFPVEYCEFSNCWPKCSVSLKDKHPQLFEKFKAAKEAKALAAKQKAQAELAAKDPEAAAAALAKEEEDAAARAAKKSAGPDEDGDEDDEDDEDDGELTFTDTTPGAGDGPKKEITIQVTERTKRKRVTTVSGAENFGITQKDLAKQFAKKFATSASSSDEGIVLNGDLLYDIADFMLEQYPDIPEKAFIRIEKGGIRKKMF